MWNTNSALGRTLLQATPKGIYWFASNTSRTIALAGAYARSRGAGGTMGQELADDTKLVAVQDNLTSDVEGEKVVLQTETETYYGIEGVGATAWDLLQQPHSIAELQEAIVSEYDVDPERCRRDLEAFVTDLVENGLVERVSDSAGTSDGSEVSDGSGASDDLEVSDDSGVSTDPETSDDPERR